MKINKLALVAVTAALAATTFAAPPPRGGFRGHGPAPHGRFHGGPPAGFHHHHHHHHGSAAAAVVGAGIFGLVTGAILASEPAPRTTVVRETVYTPAPTVIQQPVIVQQPAVVQQPVVVQPAQIVVPPPVTAQPIVVPHGSTVIIRQQ